MKVQFTLRQINVSDELRSLIESKIEKHIGPHLPDDAEVRVTLTMEKAWTFIDLLVQFKGETFKASKKATDIYPVLENVIEKLARQIAKHKDIGVDKRKH